MRLRLPRLRSGFPFTAPTWPNTVERPPLERTTGIDYDTTWARKYGVRLARAVVLDSIGRAGIEVLASPRVRGTDRLVDLEGPVVFAANHASHLDTPLLLTTLPERFRHRTVVAAGADYFFDKRWKAAMWAFAINAIPFERTRASPKSLRLCGQMLSDGWSLVIFPEGGRSPSGWGQEHTAGAAWLALRAKVPIVPVHLEGTRRVLRKGANRIRPSVTNVTFGPPLRAAEGDDPRDFAARIEKAIAELADEQKTDWWTARVHAGKGETPTLTGPRAGAWRRAWALNEHPRRKAGATTRWP
jgi:1-acyl-sn-glycerol-3-phosphate acyltransferase